MVRIAAPYNPDKEEARDSSLSVTSASNGRDSDLDETEESVKGLLTEDIDEELEKRLTTAE